jgi:hypothetical protein
MGYIHQHLMYLISAMYWCGCGAADGAVCVHNTIDHGHPDAPRTWVASIQHGCGACLLLNIDYVVCLSATCLCFRAAYWWFLLFSSCLCQQHTWCGAVLAHKSSWLAAWLGASSAAHTAASGTIVAIGVNANRRACPASTQTCAELGAQSCKHLHVLHAASAHTLDNSSSRQCW